MTLRISLCPRSWRGILLLCSFVHLSVGPFVGYTYHRDIILKFYMWYEDGKLNDPYFMCVRKTGSFSYAPFFDGHNEILSA